AGGGAETAPTCRTLEGAGVVGRGRGPMMTRTPPIRSKEHGEALWRGLLDGTVEVIATDHSPHTPEEKMADSPMGDIWKAIAGMPGVETSVALMLTQVNTGRMTLN